MGTKMKVAFAAVLLALLLGVGLVVLSNPGNGGEQPVAPDPDREKVAVVSDQPVPPTLNEDTASEPEARDPVVSREATVRVGLAFTDEDGRAIDTEEVLARYAAAGMPLTVRVVPEAFFTGGEVADLFRTRANPVDDWTDAVAIVAEDGALRLETPPDGGQHRLLIGRPDAAPMLSPSFTVRDDAPAELAIQLPSEPDLKRYRLVSAENGTLLAGATVTPWYEFGDDVVFLPGPALTANDQGEVELAVLEDAVRGKSRQPTWWVETDTHLGRIPRMSLHVEDGGNTATIPIARSCTISGTAYLANGEYAVGRSAVWTQKGQTARAVIGEDGKFELGPVCAENDSAEVAMIEDLESLRVQVGRAKVVAGETVTMQIGKPKGSTQNAVIAGTVTVGGRPLAGAFVITRTESVKGGENFIATAADGTYRKEDVAPGQVRVQLYFGDPRVVDDFYLKSSEALDLAAGNEKTLDFDLPGGAFEVTVLDDATGEPIPGAVAIGRPMERDAGTDLFPGFRYKPGWGIRVDTGGRALLLAMLQGEPHRLMAGADGYQKKEIENELPGTGDRPAQVTIRLTKKD